MSIINDALKKLQQGQSPKPETPPTAPASGPVFQDLPSHAEVKDIEQAPSDKNQFLPLIAFVLIAASIFLAYFIFKQGSKYFPQVAKSAKSSILQWMHVKEEPAFKTKAAADLVPLAKINVNPSVSTGASLAKPDSNLTLNIHGIMSKGSQNFVLINDQVYQEGDDVDGIKIVKIDLGSITVINNGREEIIRVKR